MGDSYRDYIKGRQRARNRAGQANNLQASINARSKAIKEKNRKKAAKQGQYQLRLIKEWHDEELGLIS